MALIIRAANHADVGAILALGRVMHEESRFREHPLNHDKAMRAVRQQIDNPAGILFIAVRHDPEGGSDQGVIGMLGAYLSTLFFSDAVVAQELAYYVHPAHRGSPAAVKLLVAYRRWAEMQQAVEINVSMSSAIDVEGSNRLMGKLGFSCCGANFTLPLR